MMQCMTYQVCFIFSLEWAYTSQRKIPGMIAGQSKFQDMVRSSDKRRKGHPKLSKELTAVVYSCGSTGR